MTHYRRVPKELFREVNQAMEGSRYSGGGVGALFYSHVGHCMSESIYHTGAMTRHKKLGRNGIKFHI